MSTENTAATVVDGVVAIIGAGNMGEALLRGVLRAGVVRPERVVCTVRSSERAEYLERELGVRVTTDNRDAVRHASLVVIALKPQVLLDELALFADDLDAEACVMSVAAGVRISAIEALVAKRVAVIRVMPNTPALVDAGMSAVSAGTHASADDVAIAHAVLGAVGRVVTVEEDALDAVTAVSGSGPAYVFHFAEAMIDAACAQGLERDLAETLVIQTLLGAATLLDREKDAAALRRRVTSPGGTTQAALDELERRDVRGAIAAAVAAARRRAAELGG